MNVEELLAGVPVGFLYAGLVTWALSRSTFYYCSGRFATSRLPDDGKAAQVRATVARLGARSVLVAWPVPGLSAATQIANGAARVPVRSFAAVVVPVVLVWSGLQTVFGVAVFAAFTQGAAPWLVGALAVGAMVYVVRRRRRRSSPGEAPGTSCKDHILVDAVQHVDTA